ncbi:MAG: PriCT-2 domain-containing protein, partial [Planctomycetes bacterium]|nr:PriCT-2 domain-containing protein [Planctomycetota bacterium]
MREYLERIRAGHWSPAIVHVRKVRETKGAKAYKAAKENLPAIAFAGRFSGRCNAGLIEHSGCINYDYDHLGDVQDARRKLEASPHVVFCFVSPSGEGLKLGLRVSPCADDAEHKIVWAAGAKYLRKLLGGDVKEDKGCKDVARLCFVSHDPDTYINEAATVFELPPPEPDPDELGILSFNAEADYGEYAADADHVVDSDKRSDADKARAALARMNPSRADDYTSWSEVGMACKTAGLAFSEWDSWSRQSAKYDADVCRQKWDTFQRNDLNVGSLIRWARIDNGEPPTLKEAGAIEGTELWFSRVIANQHSHHLKHVWPWKSWMGWDNAGHWRRDETGIAWQAAKSTLKRMAAAAAKAAGTDAGKEALERCAKYSRKTALENALKLTASELDITVLPTEWDADPYLLNCSNGTVDLRDGKLREHRKDDLITKSTKIAAGGDAPRWRAFLAQIIPDPDVRDYLQRAVGYSAIGIVTEHVLHIAWGGGANGKSVFFNAITHALGDYASTVPGTLLVSDGLREHPTVIASLHGIRFALASETEEDGRVRAAQLKQLTGGDTLTARRMREDFWSFEPSHTLWLQTNHKPQTREATHGFWRRVRLIPFTVTIPSEQQDKDLTGKLRAEAGGILQWIIDGALQYLTDGLEPPEAIVAATAEYQQEQDELADFLECCGLVAD